MRGTASSVCVKGSVDGVRTAAATVAPTTTKRHCLNICSDETMPVFPSSTWMMGTYMHVHGPQQLPASQRCMTSATGGSCKGAVYTMEQNGSVSACPTEHLIVIKLTASTTFCCTGGEVHGSLLAWKDSPVLSMSTSTNSKYWSMDQRDSTAPSAYVTKKFRAAGVRIS